MEDQPQNIAELEDRILKKDRTVFYNYCNQLAKVNPENEGKSKDDDMNKLIFDLKNDERKKIISKYIINDINGIKTPEKISNSKEITNTVHLTDIETNVRDAFLALKLNGVIKEILYDEKDGRIKLKINENFQGQILFTGDLTASKLGNFFPYEHSLMTVELFDELRKEINKHNEKYKNKQITFAAVPGNHEFLDTFGQEGAFGYYGGKQKINGQEYKVSEINFVKSKIMAIKVIAEIQKDYLERCRNEKIDINDNDLEKIGYHFDIDDKIKKLEGLINEMDNVLNTEKELQEFIEEYNKQMNPDECEKHNQETKKLTYYKTGGKLKYQIPFDEKCKQFFWRTSDLLHTLIINDGQNKKRIMHNPVYLFDEETIYYYQKNHKKIEKALNKGNYDEDYVKEMKKCFIKNEITQTSCVIIAKKEIGLGFGHELDTVNRRYLYDKIFLTIPTFYGHEGNEKIDKWGAGICTDDHYSDPCKEDSIHRRCLFVSEKDKDGLIKIEKYEEEGSFQGKPKRVGVFYICPNREKREEIEKKNNEITKLREEAKNGIKKPNAVGKIYDILENLIATGIEEYKWFDEYNAATGGEKENLRQWYKKIKSLKRAFRSLHEYYENKEINLFNKKIKEAGISDDGILNTDVKIENTINVKQVKQIIEDIKNTLYDIDDFKKLIEDTGTLNKIYDVSIFGDRLSTAKDKLNKEENKNLLNDFITEICEELKIKKSDIDNEEKEQEENKEDNNEINTNTNQNKTMQQNNIFNQNDKNTNNYTGQQSSSIPKMERRSMKTPIIHKVNENDDEINTNTNQNKTTSTNTNQNGTMPQKNIFNQNYNNTNNFKPKTSNIPITGKHSTENPIKDFPFSEVRKECYDINENIKEKSKILENLLSNGIPKNFSTTIENERKSKIERLDSKAIYHILTSENEIISRNRGNKLTRLFDSRKYRYNEFCELIEKKFKEIKNISLEIPDEKPLEVVEEDFKEVWNEVVSGEDLKDVFRDTAFFGCCG